MAKRGRPTTHDQCRAQKPQTETDTKITHCGRRLGHVGPHSAGRYVKWVTAYTPPKRTA